MQTRAEQAREILRWLGVSATNAHLLKETPQRELRRAAEELQLVSAVATPTLAHLTYGADLLPRHPIQAARNRRDNSDPVDYRDKSALCGALRPR